MAEAAVVGGRGASLHLVLSRVEALFLLKIALESVAGFTFALEIIGMIALVMTSAMGSGDVRIAKRKITHNAVPALIGAACSIRFPHKVGALLISNSVASHISSTVGDRGRSLQRHVPDERILDILSRCSADRLHVGVLDGGDGGVLLVLIAAGEGGVVGAAMVIGSADSVERVDGIGDGHVLLSKVRGAVSGAGLLPKDVEGSVGHVAGVSLNQGVVSTESNVAVAEASVVLNLRTMRRIRGANTRRTVHRPVWWESSRAVYWSRRRRSWWGDQGLLRVSIQGAVKRVGRVEA